MKLIFILLLSALSARAQSPLEAILTEDAIRTLRDPFRAPNILLLQKEAPRSDLEIFALHLT